METARLDGAQLRSQTLERPRQPRLHGASRNPERFGCLALRQLEEIARRNDLAVFVAECVQRPEKDLPALVGEDRRLRRWSRIVGAAVLSGAKREVRAATRGSAAVA